jgi:putative hydrolase of the HAD superfamily
MPPEPYVAALVSAFSCHAPAELPAYPGALAALDRLGALVPVVLVTDGNPRIQRAKIDALGLVPRLAGVVVSDELGGRAVRKPHPAAFERALALLGLPAAEVVHIGDRPAKDVAGARGVGMRCVRVRTGEYADLPDPAGLDPWWTADSFAAAVARLVDDLGWDAPSARTGTRAAAGGL